MNSLAVDMKDILVSEGIGTFAATSGWGIFVSREPDKPNTAITLFDTGGRAPNPAFILDEPSFQVRIRGEKGGYVAAYAKADAIKRVFLGRPAETISATNYQGWWAESDILFLAYDENDRPLLTINFRVAREATADSTDYRKGL